MRATTRLREMLRGDRIVMAPGAHDALAATLIEREGFEALYITGGGSTMAAFGKPDVGLTTRTQRAMQARLITDAVDIPVVCDADDGFGNAVSVIQTVREFETAGVAAIHIEDQRQPRRCGFLAGGSLLPMNEMLGKVRAAVDARRDPDFTIIARVESKMASSFNETLERGHAYLEAGADMLFVNGLLNMEQVERVAREYDRPQLFNVSTSGETPYVPIETLQSLGFKIAIYPAFALAAAMKAMIGLYHELKTTGTIAGYVDQMVDFKQFNALVNLSKYQEQDLKYGG